MIGFTQAVALEVGKHNVTINAVCPGPVNTELIQKSVSQSAAIKGVSPAQFITGSSLNVSGGREMHGSPWGLGEPRPSRRAVASDQFRNGSRSGGCGPRHNSGA